MTNFGKYPDAKLHMIHRQPVPTLGKMVMYRPYQGHWHAPYFADELNWGHAELGRIFEYRIVGN